MPSKTELQQFAAEILARVLHDIDYKKVPPKLIWERTLSAVIEARGAEDIARFVETLQSNLQIQVLWPQTANWIFSKAVPRAAALGWELVRAEVEAVPRFIVAYARIKHQEDKIATADKEFRDE
jgi:hypothetical protein